MAKTSVVSRVLAVVGIVFGAAAIVASVAMTRIGPEDYGTGLVLIVVSIGCWLAGLALSIVAIVLSRARGWFGWGGIAISLVLPVWTVVVLLQAMGGGT